MLPIAATMIDLTDENKLFARSTPDINEAFTNLVARVAKNEAIRYRDKRKPHKSSVMNAILLWVASRPREEQDAIVSEGMAALNRHLDTGDLNLEPVRPLPVPPNATHTIAIKGGAKKRGPKRA